MPYGFTHGKYLETLYSERIHVATDPSVIVREAWRRWHIREGEHTQSKDQFKDDVRYLLQEYLYKQCICRDFRL